MFISSRKKKVNDKGGVKMKSVREQNRIGFKQITCHDGYLFGLDNFGAVWGLDLRTKEDDEHEENKTNPWKHFAEYDESETNLSSWNQLVSPCDGDRVIDVGYFLSNKVIKKKVTKNKR